MVQSGPIRYEMLSLSTSCVRCAVTYVRVGVLQSLPARIKPEADGGIETLKAPGAYHPFVKGGS